MFYKILVPRDINRLSVGKAFYIQASLGNAGLDKGKHFPTQLIRAFTL